MIVKNRKTFKVLSMGELMEFPNELAAIKAEFSWTMGPKERAVLDRKWDKVSNDDIRKILSPVPEFGTAFEAEYREYCRTVVLPDDC